MIEVGMIPRASRGKITVTPQNVDIIMNALWPGDVIMKWKDDGFTSNVINYAQRRHGYPPQSPETTHVSMYIGENEVFHATYSLTNAEKSQTRRQSFVEYYMGHEISVGRYEPTDLPKNASVRQRLVEQCKREEGRPYDLRLVFWGELEGVNMGPAITQLAEAQRNLLSGELGRGQICSTIIFEVFKKVLGRSNPVRIGIAANGPYVMPADFFLSPRLVQVEFPRTIAA